MKIIVCFITLCYTFILHAAGNYQAGEAKSVTCAACHGAKGVSSNPEWPSLAGQHRDYFIKQLIDFKQGQARPSAIMGPLALGLSLQDMADLAVFYENQPLPEKTTPASYLKRGEMLYRGGNFDKHITACIACHGPQGTGNAQAGFPVISGQQPAYTVLQLNLFKDGKRRNDLNAIMRDISARMDQDDMNAVANYMAGLH